MSDFEKAFTLAMWSEVGPFFDETDPEVQQGRCGTKQQRRKTGYVNDPDDAGGETKFGVAKNSHQNIDITNLTLAEARKIYEQDYWIKPGCERFSYPLNVIYFDSLVNHGPGAAKMLQRAVGVEPDGAIGPKTLAKVSSQDPVLMAGLLLDEREQFYRRIVERKPAQAKFLNGWLNRIKHCRDSIAS